MNKITTLTELAVQLGKKTNVKAWEKGGKKRLYFKSYGYNTSKMKTDAYLDLSNEQATAFVRIDCPSQSNTWIESQEAEVRERLQKYVRYCNRFFAFCTSGQPAEVVMNNALLAAEPVQGYYTEWRNVRVSINRFGKLADRNRQFVVPFEGTKENAPREFVPLSDKAYAYLRKAGEQMLQPYSTVPDYDAKAATYEKMIMDQSERDYLAQETATNKAAQEKIKLQLQMQRIADLQKEGLSILQAWKQSGCPHPAPAEVCEAKKASGLNWQQFAQAL